MSRVQRRKGVRESRGSASLAKRKPSQLGDASFDQESLQRQKYLTVREAMAYLSGFSTRGAFYVWVRRAGVPKCRANGLRFRRADLDKAVQPAGDAAHE